MTDEEKAEEYIKNVRTEWENQTYWVDCTDEVKQAYLDGLAEGRKEKWHDLRKNPNDLPTATNSQFLWICWINPYGNMCYHQCYYDNKGFYWIDEEFYTKYYPILDIIAWCELPEFC